MEVFSYQIIKKNFFTYIKILVINFSSILINMPLAKTEDSYIKTRLLNFFKIAKQSL